MAGSSELDHVEVEFGVRPAAGSRMGASALCVSQSDLLTSPLSSSPLIIQTNMPIPTRKLADRQVGAIGYGSSISGARHRQADVQACDVY